jgi:hypothetical protein
VVILETLRHPVESVAPGFLLIKKKTPKNLGIWYRYEVVRRFFFGGPSGAGASNGGSGVPLGWESSPLLAGAWSCHEGTLSIEAFSFRHGSGCCFSCCLCLWSE